MTTPAADDDERTVFKTTHEPRVAASRGLPGATLTKDCADALPAGARLNEFEILSVIGQGGFGIVYLAHDLTLDRRVAIKEYMPGALATRTQAMTVEVRSSRHTDTFAAGLRSFVNEAKLLAQFDHPSLLKVHRFWEAHGTAYMVMPYYAGTTFAQALAQAGGEPPNEARLRALLDPLLDALALMHAARCYHRDIAPDNILLLPGGTPLLLDFGAARRVIGDMTQALTVILKTGYAPVEQYGAMPDMTQGAWTDLYALASVVEFAITGHTPPQAVTRFLADKREPLALRAKGRYGDAFLRAIDQALAVLPKDRPQSVAEMRALLAAGAPPPLPARSVRIEPSDVTVPMGDAVPASIAPAVASTTASPRMRQRATVIAMAGALIAVVVIVGGYAWWSAPAAPVEAPAASPPPAPQAMPAPAIVEEVPAASPSPAPPAASVAPIEIEPAPALAPAAAAPTMTEVMLPPAGGNPDAPRAPKHTATPPIQKPVTAALAPARTPNKKLPNARCADIIQRVSLGEPLSDADKAILQRECGP